MTAAQIKKRLDGWETLSCNSEFLRERIIAVSEFKVVTHKTYRLLPVEIKAINQRTLYQQFSIILSAKLAGRGGCITHFR